MNIYRRVQLSLTKVMVCLFALTPFILHSQLAIADDIVNAGKTIVSRGAVSALAIEKNRKLKRRSPVFSNDKIITGEESSTQIRMVDGGLLSLQSNSELEIVDYEFNQKDQDGQVRLSLLKGGLRTVTGSLTASAKKYQMQTPVASIGVRGTHYEAEIVGGNLFLAVWEGDIDVDVEVGEQPGNFSLGSNEDFSFASVQPSGEVQLLLEVPSVFSVGHSEQAKPKAKQASENKANADDETNKSEKNKAITSNNIAKKITSTAQSVNKAISGGTVSGNIKSPAIALALTQVEPNVNAITPQLSEIFANEEQIDLNALSSIRENLLDENLIDLSSTAIEIIAARTGSTTYSQIENLGAVSSLGEITNMEMSMNVDFDTGKIPEGELSFNDDAGRWFAAFDGVIGKESLELNVNFASHGDNVATGSIDGVFITDATQVLGEFSLQERDDDSAEASGAFILTEEPE